MKSTVAAVMIVSLAWPGAGPAWADADEASVHAGLLMGAGVANTRAFGPAEVTPSAGLCGKLTYATSDWYAFEAMVELEHSAGAASFDGPVQGMYPGWDRDRDEDDSFERQMGWFRGEAGISARLGVRWIPTVHAGLGVQVQVAGAGRELYQGHSLPGPGRDVTLDVTGVVGVGLDYRLDEHWVIGTGVRVRHSFPWSWREAGYSAVSVAMHVGYYWYPNNMAR